MPKIVSVSPAAGSVDGATSITINGSNFLACAKVLIGGLPAVGIEVAPTSIAAKTPAHPAGKVDVEVSNPDNSKATLPGGFTYVSN